MQLPLFAPPPETIRSPLCLYERWCGRGQAVLGTPEDRGGCINTPITCLQCGMEGVRSERKERQESA